MYFLFWLGWKDLNPQMLESESRALTDLATPQIYFKKLAGVAGFGPTHNRVKVCCLTAWRYPYVIVVSLKLWGE